MSNQGANRHSRQNGLEALGALGGHLGGAPVIRASLRVTVGGALATAVAAAIGRLVVLTEMALQLDGTRFSLKARSHVST